MSAYATFTREQFNTEYDDFARSALWELNNIQKALTMMRFINDDIQEARLAAVKQIKRERAARKRNAA